MLLICCGGSGPAGLMHLKGWPIKEGLHGIGVDDEVQLKVFSLLEEAAQIKYDI